MRGILSNQVEIARSRRFIVQCTVECSRCGRQLSTGEVVYATDGNTLCTDCMTLARLRYSRCFVCGADNAVEVWRGVSICRNCARGICDTYWQSSSERIRCAFCGRRIRMHKQLGPYRLCGHCVATLYEVAVNGREEYVHCAVCGARLGACEHQVCSECWESHVQCEICQDWVARNEAIERGGYWLCPTCAAEYDLCPRCESLVYVRDMVQDDYYGAVCADCAEDLAEQREDADACGIIAPYSYKPAPDFRKERWENTLYIGFELEVECDSADYLDEVAERVLELGGERYYAKSDSSLEYGFELVSHPATWKAHRAVSRIHEVLQELKDAGAYAASTCGLHFHLDRKWFEPVDEVKLTRFFHNAREQIFRISGRSSWLKLEEWARVEYFGLSSLVYGLRYALKMGERRSPSCRYLALNFTNKNTIEIRIFASTLEHAEFLANLQFADAVAHFIRVAGYNSKWPDFCAWLRTRGYCHLVEKLKRLGIWHPRGSLAEWTYPEEVA